MKLFSKSIAPILTLSILLAGSSLHGGSREEKTSDLITGLQVASRIPGLSVAIAVDGKMAYSKGFGSSDLEQGHRVSPATLFRTGSVAKMMTALATMRLVDRGLLDLDQPVRELAGPLSELDPGITPRLLAGHLAGIRHYLDKDQGIDGKHFVSTEEALSIFLNDPLVSAPGSQYRYSTFGYTLLAAALERASGNSFLEILRQEVWIPLGLTRSRADRPAEIIGGRSRFYNLSASSLEHAPYTDPSYKYAGGGLLSTSEDLVRMAVGMLEQGYLSDASRHELFQVQSTTDGKPTGVGVGWRVGRDMWGNQMLHHAGSIAGGRAFVVILPELNVAAAMMSNLSGMPLFIETTVQLLLEPFLSDSDGSRELSHDLPQGRFNYTGTFRGVPVEGTFTFSRTGEEKPIGRMTTPEPLLELARSNGIAMPREFQLVAWTARGNQLIGVLETSLGLLDLAFEKTENGFKIKKQEGLMDLDLELRR